MGGILSRRNVLRAMREMDPYTFEQFVADVWDKQGFDTTVRSGSGDRGIDIIARKGDTKQLLQVKRYSQSNKIGSEIVRKYATLYQQVEDADEVVIVTTGFFTDDGRQLARDLEVETINADQLFQTVNVHAPDIAVEYLHESVTSLRSRDSPQSINSQQETKTAGRTTTADPAPPFTNEKGYSKISTNQGYFDRCPECSEDAIWFGQLKWNNQTILLKCGNCQSKWEKITEMEGWLFKKEVTKGWKQVSGPHRGAVLSVEEWFQI